MTFNTKLIVLWVVILSLILVGCYANRTRKTYTDHTSGQPPTDLYTPPEILKGEYGYVFPDKGEYYCYNLAGKLLGIYKTEAEAKAAVGITQK